MHTSLEVAAERARGELQRAALGAGVDNLKCYYISLSLSLYIYIYIYICIERERCMCVYIYIYTYIHV